nr:H/ACA ribonucleoprotein complex non-core subunit NAF1 [Zootoca vivipara]
MDELPASRDSGDSGLVGCQVTQRLQLLSVAGGPEGTSAGTCPPALAVKAGEKGATEASEAPTRLPEEAGPHGGGVEGGAPQPGPCPGLLQPSGTAEEEPLGNGSSSAASVSGPRLSFNAGEGGEPGAGHRRDPDVPAAPADETLLLGEGREEKPPPPDLRSSPSCLPDFNGDPQDVGLGVAEESRPAPLGIEQDSPAMEGGGGGSSSDSDSDTDSSSTDSSSSVSSSSCLPMLSEDDDQQSKTENNSCPNRKKGESCEQEPLPVEDFTIILPESVELMPFGKVSSIIEHLVIIESQKGLPPVNEDTVLFKEDRHSMGKVFEVFGPVSHPFYVLQFNSPEHIESKGIKMHEAVYFAPSVESFTQYIFPEKIKQERGSDASWKNDEEPPPEALDYSDDEKERAAKQKKKSQNLKRKKCRPQPEDSNGNGVHYQPRRQYPSDYSHGYFGREPNPTFARSRFPHSSASPRSFQQYGTSPQHYSNFTELPKPSAFCQQQRQESLRRHQYSFPPPTFETVNNEANFPPPPPSATWGWPHECSQNAYDPLFSLLSLPPPPPPPIPPPPAAPHNAHLP